MAIIPNAAPSYQNPQASAQPAPNPAQPQENQPPLWSFNETRFYGAPISRGVGSEMLIKLRDSLVEVFKTADQNIEIMLLTLDRVDEPNLAFSAIIVCLRDKSAPQIGVAFHVLIMEATGEPLGAIMVNEHGTQVEYLKVTGDALDERLIFLAEGKVRRSFPQSPIYAVDGCVIPRTFDSDNKTLVHQVALNAALACSIEIRTRSPDFADANLALIPKDNRLVVTMAFDNQQLVDMVGAPMRSDVLISLTSQQITNGQNQNQQAAFASVHSPDRKTLVSELSAYLDLSWIYAKPQFGGMQYPQYPGYPQPPQPRYAARMIVTNISNPMSYTLSSVLLSLYTAMAAGEDNNWIQSFRPKATANKNEIDLRDIGALAIEANITDDPSGFSPRIDTKTDTFELQHVGELIQRLVQPGLMIAIDIPECGPQTWYMSVFMAAATEAYRATLIPQMGSPAQQNDIGAYTAIYKAAMTLTNGAFGNHFPWLTPMFTDLNNRVHLGHWRDRNMQIRDIRDIDYLAVANLLGDTNPSMIQEWSDTWSVNGMSQRMPLSMRLAKRKSLIERLTQNQAVFTGFAQRVTFTAEFLRALSAGCMNAGLKATVETPISSALYNQQRGVAGFVNSALLTPNQAFFAQAAPTQGPFYAAPGYYGRRW